MAELVVVKRFGEAIFPALRHVESVLRGGDAPHHSLIEADNYHALQLLEWLYAGKVDCIYIDPPYNTGARDWKYNNSYVDKNDSYRHSKWLSMMKKRLILAHRLLRSDGVLIPNDRPKRASAHHALARRGDTDREHPDRYDLHHAEWNIRGRTLTGRGIRPLLFLR